MVLVSAVEVVPVPEDELKPTLPEPPPPPQLASPKESVRAVASRIKFLMLHLQVQIPVQLFLSSKLRAKSGSTMRLKEIRVFSGKFDELEGYSRKFFRIDERGANLKEVKF